MTNNQFFKSLKIRTLDYKHKLYRALFEKAINELTGRNNKCKLIRDYSIFVFPQNLNIHRKGYTTLRQTHSLNIKNNGIGNNIFSHDLLMNVMKYRKKEFNKDAFANIYLENKRNPYQPHYYQSKYNNNKIYQNKSSSLNKIFGNRIKSYQNNQATQLSNVNQSRNAKSKIKWTSKSLSVMN